MLTNLGALEWPHHDRTGACLLRYPDRGARRIGAERADIPTAHAARRGSTRRIDAHRAGQRAAVGRQCAGSAGAIAGGHRHRAGSRRPGRRTAWCVRGYGGVVAVLGDTAARTALGVSRNRAKRWRWRMAIRATVATGGSGGTGQNGGNGRVGLGYGVAAAMGGQGGAGANGAAGQPGKRAGPAATARRWMDLWSRWTWWGRRKRGQRHSARGCVGRLRWGRRRKRGFGWSRWTVVRQRRQRLGRWHGRTRH